MFGIKEKDAKKIAAGFGGGIAYNQKICSALSGAIILLGCKYFNDNIPKESKENVYKKINEYLNEFKKIHTSTECIELIEIDLSTEGGRKKAKKQDVFNLKCTKYIEDACRLPKKVLLA